MSYHTHTVSEWLSMLSLATSGYASFSVFYFLLVDADARDFDPRPAVRRALESGPLTPAWQAAVDAGHTANRGIALGKGLGHDAADRARHVPRDAAVTVAALLMLLTSAPGDTR